MDVQKPMYKHDCDKCIFLGNLEVDEDNPWVTQGTKVVDLYVCVEQIIPTFVARCSDEPSDYISGWSYQYLLSDVYERYPIVEAFKRAYMSDIISVKIGKGNNYEFYSAEERIW